MSTPLPQRVRLAVRTTTAVVLGAAVIAVPTTAMADQSASKAPTDPTPWTSVSDVIAQSLQRMEAAGGDIQPAPAPESSATAEPAPAPSVFATVDDEVELVEPSTQMEAIGFHEGSTASLELSPKGEAAVNRSWIDTPAATDGPQYAIMASRGRGVGPTTAADLAVPAGTEVASIVTGEVVSVNHYSLYGETPDVFIEIAPEGRPDLKVQMFHLSDVTVEVGDQVVAGETVVAGSSRTLPFGSQIDKHVGHAGPHVHVQVVRG